jgi:putative metallohydrolase (TIGR04338 family)
MIRSTRTRDFQRQRVYDAELAALPKDTVGATLKEVQAYADKITGYAWFRRRWGARTIKVAAIRGSGGFVYDNSSTINIGLNVTGGGALRRLVLHEIAHTVSHGERHGPGYTRAMLELVVGVFGQEVASKLRTEYRAHKVKVGPRTPLKATLDPPKPKPLTWRVVATVNGVQHALTVEALTMRSALYNVPLDMTLEVTELRIWKGRASPVAKAALKSPRRKLA